MTNVAALRLVGKVLVSAWQLTHCWANRVCPFNATDDDALLGALELVVATELEIVLTEEAEEVGITYANVAGVVAVAGMLSV